MRRKMTCMALTVVCVFVIGTLAKGDDLRKTFQQFTAQQQGKMQRSQSQSVPGESGNRNNPSDRFVPGRSLLLPPGNRQIPRFRAQQPRQVIPGQILQGDLYQHSIQQQIHPQPQPQIQPGESYYYDQYGRRIIIPQPQIQPGNQLPNMHVPNSQPLKSIGHSSSDIPSAPVNMASNPHIVIRCPGSTAETLSYSLRSSKGSYQFSITGGQEQRFRQSTQWNISFHDGMTSRQFRLEGGKTYTIKKNHDNHWSLTGIQHPGS